MGSMLIYDIVCGEFWVSLFRLLIPASGDAAIDAGVGVKGHDSAVSAAASAAA